MPSTTTNILSVDDAIEAIMLRERTAKPLIVSVTSLERNAGKTYFCMRAKELLCRPGFFDTFVTYSPGTEETLKRNFDGLEYLFYDVGVDSTVAAPWTGDVMRPYRNTMRAATGRDIDMTAVVYNPWQQRLEDRELERLTKEFDIVIVNPHANKK